MWPNSKNILKFKELFIDLSSLCYFEMKPTNRSKENNVNNSLALDPRFAKFSQETRMD